MVSVVKSKCFMLAPPSQCGATLGSLSGKQDESSTKIAIELRMRYFPPILGLERDLCTFAQSLCEWVFGNPKRFSS